MKLGEMLEWDLEDVLEFIQDNQEMIVVESYVVEEETED